MTVISTAPANFNESAADQALSNLLGEQVTVAALQSLFAPAPTLQTFENAAMASVNPTESEASSLGLKLLTDRSGNPVTISTASGVNATAYVDAQGAVIITYQATSSNVQDSLDLQILSGAAPSTVKGYADALSFAEKAQQVALSEGYFPSNIYVTGHSLGGTLASYVASQTGLPGVSFASAGIPGYQAPATPAANFISYVEKGDPFANYATDSAEAGSAGVANPHVDHYGTVVELGSSADAAALASFATSIKGVNIVAALDGQTSLSPTQVNTLENEFYTLLNEHHALSYYEADASGATIPATAYGTQNTSVSTLISSIAADLPKLLAQVPALFSSPNYATAFQTFQSEFPDLASETTSLMHASSFSTAISDLTTLSPSLAADFASPAKLETALSAFASTLQQPAHATVGGASTTTVSSTSAVTAIAANHH